MLIRINNLIKDEKSFAFETTLSSKGYVNLIQNCRDAGYVVNLIFLYISNPIINIGRVEDRVRNGGHNIEDSVIQIRYYRGIENLISSYFCRLLIMLCCLMVLICNSVLRKTG
jgi:predicted ABC-type ATPase